MLAVGAVAASGLTALGAASLPGDSLVVPQAAADTGRFAWQVGQGYSFTDSQGEYHWLGANANPSGREGLLWCIEYGPMALTSAADMVSWSDVTDADQRTDVDPALKVTANQLAAILKWYEPTDTADSRAAIALLVHANYDLKADAARVTNEALTRYPAAAALARQYVSEARTGVIHDTAAGQGSSESARRTGNVHGIQALAEDGTLLAEVDVTVTLSGPAVFDATGTNEWSGKTGTEPVTLAWTATGNGEVSYTATYPSGRVQMWKYSNSGKLQDMLERGRTVSMDPETGPSVPAFYDFQPVATSSVAEAGSKVVDHAATSLSDTIHVTADESYTQSPKWMYDAATGDFVPVVFEGTAYYVGERPAENPGSVPEGAQVVGTTTVTATGPGTYTATITTPDGKPIDSQFVTWVWSVKKTSQGDWASYVAADWSDSWGVAEETTSVREKVEVDSTMAVNETKSGKHLVDSLYISGFDADHTEFEGGSGFAADVDEMTQSLFFFPEGLEVTDANKDKATLVASVQVPARNGYVDRVGSGEFKMLEGSPVGTYVFVTEFPGDDRTEAFTSSVSDPYEQFRVEPVQPEIRTTATDKADGDKTLGDEGDQTITDKVCQVEGKPLEVGRTYDLTATAMDKATGEALLDEEGRPYTGAAQFTPESEEDCGSVDVTIPASRANGKQITMFEAVTLDGVTVAVHTDISSVEQTVDGGKKPEPEPRPKKASLARTGGAAVALLALAGAGIGSGTALVRRRGGSEQD